VILGIWHKPEEVTLSQLRKEGFNAVFITTKWNEFDTMKTYLNRLWEMYIEAKRLGFIYFLIDYGQGVGAAEVPANYNYQLVYQAFKNEDVIFYSGEPYENYVERMKIKEEDMRKSLYEKIQTCNQRFLTDSTVRNHEKILRIQNAYSKIRIAISSYWRQERYWRDTNFVWISGQLGYHNLSSWRYKHLAKCAKETENEIIFLYQANPSDWTSDGWENKLFEFVFNKKSRLNLEAYRRKKFIEAFRGI